MNIGDKGRIVKATNMAKSADGHPLNEKLDRRNDAKYNRNTNSSTKKSDFTSKRRNYSEDIARRDNTGKKGNITGKTRTDGKAGITRIVGTDERAGKVGNVRIDGKVGITRKAGIVVKEAANKKDRNNNNENFNRRNSFNGKDNRFGKDNKTGKDYRVVKDSINRNSSVKGKDACPYLKECGGCNYLKQSYEIELSKKQKMVEELIKGYCKVAPIIGMKQPEHYRYKVHVVFDHDRKGNPVSGVYEEGTHYVVPVEACLIHNKKADEIIASIRGMLKSFKIKTYDEDTELGLLRHVMVRVGYTSGEILVVLILASPILPSKNNFVKALLKLHPEITSIVLNINDKRTSMVLGDKEHVLYGKGYIHDSLCGKVFRISPKSFYQVNPVQTEILYKKAIEMAALTGKETVIDAYCGIGTISIIAADHAKKVIGVELNKDAVRDSVTNAKLNNTVNVVFYNNDAGDFMSQMAEDKETADIVFLDPPRSGSNEQFLDALVELKPDKIIYISCNPVTLERDMKHLAKKGYRAVKAHPVDMFPWTEHVEAIVLMSRVEK